MILLWAILVALLNSIAAGLTTFSRPAIPANVLPASGECGIRWSSKKYEGNVTGLDESPWNCLIEYTMPDVDSDTFCSCVLINHQYVLTASNCVHERTIPAEWCPHKIVLGEWDKTKDPDCSDGDCAAPVQKILVSKMILHPLYDPTAKNRLHDIALIRMETPVTFNKFVIPICLPQESYLRSKKYAGEELEVFGWGNNVAGLNPKVKVRLQEVERDSCASAYLPMNTQITDKHICVTGVGGKAPSSEESGAPLVATDNNNPNQTVKYLVGLQSFGARRMLELPDVYTKVSEYVEWVQSAMEP